jgi:hypothetical protein
MLREVRKGAHEDIVANPPLVERAAETGEKLLLNESCRKA